MKSGASSLDQLDEDALRALRVQERDAVSPCARAGLLIDQADARRGQSLECSFEVGDAVRDVVQPRAALIQKFLDSRIRRRRLEQLDSAGAGANEGDVDFLALDALDPGTGGLGQEFEKWKRCGYGRYRNRNVIEWKFHGIFFCLVGLNFATLELRR
ncbi:MAG TPA: hypothetical protein VGC44_02010 [Longimicrobiales bacterium]